MNSTYTKPGLLFNSEPGSFAESTIKNRKPKIVTDVITHNQFSELILTGLKGFLHELQTGAVRPLREETIEAEFWNSELAKWDTRSWFSLPWFFAEAFFYRRLLEVTGYDDARSPYYHLDPFAPQKTQQMKHDLEGIADAPWLVVDWQSEKAFRSLLIASLWGNRADLSNITVVLDNAQQEMNGASHLELLIDDAARFEDFVRTRQRKIVYFLDNVGRELFSDLALIDFLLECQLAETVEVVCKPAPFFVSDAMIVDVHESIAMLQQSPNKALNRIGDSLTQFIQQEKITVVDQSLLNSFFMYSEMPPSFFQYLLDFDLAVMKGDANYRRIMEDRHWALESNVKELTAYFPIALLLVRTLKAELMVGLAPGQVDILRNKATDWMISGNFGVIQFVEK